MSCASVEVAPNIPQRFMFDAAMIVVTENGKVGSEWTITCQLTVLQGGSSGSDQGRENTETMGQDWTILNPDRRERMLGGVKLGEVFFSYNELDGIALLDRLRIPILPLELDDWFAGGRNVEQPGKLPGLPLDIMHIILDDVSEDFPHLVMFSCTCKAVLASAIGHLQKGLKTLYATWAGARIICLGDSTKCDEDLPVGFLTAAEREEVAFASRDDGEDDDSDDDEFQDDNFGNGGDVPYLLYARDYYQDIYTGYDYPYPGRDRSHDRTRYQRDIRNHTPSRAVAARDIAMFVRLSGLPSTRFSLPEVEYPCEEPVLFNLSKGVCVRSGALRKLTTRRGEPLTLMNALLSRICWSGSAPGDNAMHLDQAQHLELGRGKWAGDRFCVSTLEAMPRMVDGREWVDESEETDEFLYHLWRHGERGDELCDEVAKTKLASSSPKGTKGDVDSNAEVLEPERKKMRK